MLSGVRITILIVFVALLFIFRIKNGENMQVVKRHEHHKRGIVILTCSTKAEVMLREAVNICKNVTWDGWITKTRRVQEETSKMHPNNLVAVVDSDVLKNVDDIESELAKAWALWGSQRVVYSTEPFCWIGHNCDFVDFQKFYNLNSNWRGYNFVNGGGFIGTAKAISKVLQFLIANIKEFSAPNGYDDQYGAAELFRRGMVDLDYDNYFFGSFIDAKPWRLRNFFRQPSFFYKKNMRPSCIVNSHFAKHGCGWNPPKWRVNENCSAVSDAWRTRPLFIHFNGAGHKSRAKMQGVKNAIETCK